MTQRSETVLWWPGGWTGGEDSFSLGVWSPVGPAGALEPPERGPQSQQWQPGLEGLWWQGGSWMSGQNYYLGLAPNHRNCVGESFLFDQIDLCLFIAWSWGWRRNKFRSVGEESGYASIYFWFQEKSNDRYIHTLKDCMFYDTESLRRDYLNIITLCLTVVLSRQSIMFSHLKFNYTVFIVLLKNIKGILSVSIQEQWMNNLNYKSKLNVSFISPKQADLFS